MSTLLLAGVTVLALEQRVAVPFGLPQAWPTWVRESSRSSVRGSRFRARSDTTVQGLASYISCG